MIKTAGEPGGPETPRPAQLITEGKAGEEEENHKSTRT